MFIPTAVFVILFLLAPEIVLSLGLVAVAIYFWPITLAIFAIGAIIAIFSD